MTKKKAKRAIDLIDDEIRVLQDDIKIRKKYKTKIARLEKKKTWTEKDKADFALLRETARYDLDFDIAAK